MTIRHHLSDQILMAYAAGALPEAFNLIAAAHVSMCDECRARLAGYEALGGAVIETDDEVALSDGCLEAMMARLGDLPQANARAPQRRAGIFPAPLAEYVGGGLDAVRWRPVGRGVRQAILCSDDAASVRLLHIPAGQAMPDHGHKGMEMTLVLQGAFRDAHDRFGPGDVETADEDTDHTPVAETGVDCICLAATNAPLRFNSLLPRLVQPFFRI
jgi:putative transcriptional regulator